MLFFRCSSLLCVCPFCCMGKGSPSAWFPEMKASGESNIWPASLEERSLSCPPPAELQLPSFRTLNHYWRLLPAAGGEFPSKMGPLCFRLSPQLFRSGLLSHAHARPSFSDLLQVASRPSLHWSHRCLGALSDFGTPGVRPAPGSFQPSAGFRGECLPKSRLGTWRFFGAR